MAQQHDRPQITPPKGPVVLCILDGWGFREDPVDNAPAAAKIPVYQSLWSDCPHAFLKTSGLDVGLPDAQMGNSEVGHMNLGSGRVVMQELPRINRAVDSGSIGEEPAVRRLIERLESSGGACHLMGLVSPGGVHAHQTHMAALAQVLDRAGIPVRIHAFLDGRDTPPQSAIGYLEDFQAALPEEAEIATVSGRYFAMDRDKNWDRVAKAHDAIVLGEGERAPTAIAAVRASYANGKTDEFVLPAVIGDYAGMADGDGVIMANFRADRAREILTALLDPTFDGFERKRVIGFAAAAGMVDYSEALAPFLDTVFPAVDLTRTFGEVIATAGMRQLRIAETEKYAHVTFFFNGGREEVFEKEERILVPSPKVATYDLKPEMSAIEVTDKVVDAIEAKRFDVVVINYANPDMVGHTGILSAAVKAVETVDACLGRLIGAVKDSGGVMIVTADHGNVELMRDPETGEPHTAHTTFPVPAFLVNAEAAGEGLAIADGRLADVAPTLLALLGIAQPAEMTGSSLLVRRAR